MHRHVAVPAKAGPLPVAAEWRLQASRIRCVQRPGRGLSAAQWVLASTSALYLAWLWLTAPAGLSD
jgi:hypothetical protein